MSTGDEPGYAGDSITASLWAYVEQVKRGRAIGDNKGFLCNLPHRRSFSPDAAYYTGPRGGMKFYPEPPVFAVEVRSEEDYGRVAEEEMAQKRADYFAAGTLVVWDVDLQSEEVVRVYTAQHSITPTVFKRGEVANAEPAVPGWTMSVDRLFRPEWEDGAIQFSSARRSKRLALVLNSTHAMTTESGQLSRSLPMRLSP